VSVAAESVLRALEDLSAQDWPEADPARLQRARAAALAQHGRAAPLVTRIAGALDAAGPARVLELGSGAGALSLELAARGHMVTALEPSLENVIVAQVAARTAGLDERITSKRAALSGFPISTDRYDAVVSNRGLLHVPFDEVARSAADVLAPAGRVVFALHGAGPYLEQAGAELERGELEAATDRLRFVHAAALRAAMPGAALPGRPQLLDPDAAVATLRRAGIEARGEVSRGRLGAPMYIVLEGSTIGGPSAPDAFGAPGPPATGSAEDPADDSAEAALIESDRLLEAGELFEALELLEGAITRHRDVPALRIAQLLVLARGRSLSGGLTAWSALLRLLREHGGADAAYCSAAIERLADLRARDAERATLSAAEQGVSVRPFPYPYRAMLAISSDIDMMSAPRFREVHRFLNTREETPSGRGVGLDVGDSMWFYHQPSPAIDPTVAPFAYFGSRRWERPSEHAEEILHYIRCGWIDSIHAYGNFSKVTDRGEQFTRAHAEHALAELERNELQIGVWINHGDRCNIQNVGRHDYMEGDVPGSQAYHWDLTRAAGVQFAWTAAESFRYGDESAISEMHCHDGSDVWQFSRFHNASLEDAATDGLLPAVSRQLRPSRTYAPLWHPPHLHVQLSERRLDALVERGQFAIIAQHLGFARPLLGLGGPAVQALHRLRQRQDAGEILVTRTERLLHYSLAREHVRYTVAREQDRLVIDITGIEDPVGGLVRPTVERLRGVSFYVPEDTLVELRIGGVRPGGRLVAISPSDGIGPSVGVHWHEPDHTDHTREFIASNTVAAAPKDPSPYLARVRQRTDPADRKRSYAVGYAIDRYGVGLERYMERLRMLGFSARTRTLEIGAGAGQWAVALALLNPKARVEAVDTGAEFVELAAGIADELAVAGRVRFQLGDAERLEFEDASFDGALCHSVLMYVDPERVISETSRVLLPGALFYCAFSTVGLRLEALHHALGRRERAGLQTQIAHLLADRLQRLGLSRSGFSRVRSPTPDEAIALADLYGFAFVEQPGVQDARGTFLGVPKTVDFLARRREELEWRERLRALGAGDELLAELAKLVSLGAPNAVLALLRETYGNLVAAPATAQRLALIAITAAGREREPLADRLDAGLEEPLVGGLLRHQRGRYGEALALYERLDPEDPARDLLSGVALVRLAREDDALAAFRHGIDASDDVGCRLGELHVLANREDGAVVATRLAELLHALGAQTATGEESEAASSGLQTAW
jgi:SAM-dependent methyltransferase